MSLAELNQQNRVSTLFPETGKWPHGEKQMIEKSHDTEQWTEAVLRQHVEENVALFSSQALADHVREKHFSAGLPIVYLDPNEPDCLIEEYPDDRKKRVPLRVKNNEIPIPK